MSSVIFLSNGSGQIKYSTSYEIWLGSFYFLNYSFPWVKVGICSKFSSHISSQLRPPQARPCSTPAASCWHGFEWLVRHYLSEYLPRLKPRPVPRIKGNRPARDLFAPARKKERYGTPSEWVRDSCTVAVDTSSSLSCPGAWNVLGLPLLIQ